MTTCATPLADALLVDYWSDELDAAAADAVEIHIFGCASCAARLARLAALGARVAALVRAGQVRVGVTRAMVAQLARDGAQLRHYEARPGDRVACSVGARDDYIISWLDAEFTPGAAIDVEIEGPGPERVRHDDVLVDRLAGSLVLALPGDEARALPACTIRFRLYERLGADERALGEVVFEHSPQPG